MLKFVLFLLATLAVVGYGLYLLFPTAFKPSGHAGGQKRWAYLFGVILALEALVFVIAPILNWWLPKGVSTFSGAIDALFYVILAVTGVTFIAVARCSPTCCSNMAPRPAAVPFTRMAITSWK